MVTGRAGWHRRGELGGGGVREVHPKVEFVVTTWWYTSELFSRALHVRLFVRVCGVEYAPTDLADVWFALGDERKRSRKRQCEEKL